MATDGLRNRFETPGDIESDYYTSVFNNTNSPTVRPNNTTFNGPSGASGTVSIAGPAASTSTRTIIIVSLLVSTIFSVVTCSFLWWYYADTLTFFFSTTLPALEATDTGILATLATYGTYFTSIFAQLYNIQTTLNTTSINGTGTITADRVLYNEYVTCLAVNNSDVQATLDDYATLFCNIQGDITTIQGDITTLQGDVTTLQGDVTTLQGDVTTLQGDVTTLQGDVTTLQGQMSTAQTDITTLQGQTASLTYLDIYVNPTGNDGTCSVGGIACATINKAYTLVPNVVNQFAPYRILVSGYIAEGAIHAKCNTLLYGDDETYSQFSSFDLDSASASLNVACKLATKDIYFVPTGPVNFDISNYSSITFFQWTFENYSTQGGNSQPMTITGNANYNLLEFTQVGSGGSSISSLSIINMHVSTYAYFDNGNPMSVFCNNKDCVLDLNGFRVPSGGFTTNNTNSHTMVIQGSSWSNPNSQLVSFNTDVGSSTYPRGDVSFQGIINSGATSYGPAYTGAGTTGPLRTTGAPGLGYIPTTPSDWDSPVPDEQQEVNDQLAARVRSRELATNPSVYRVNQWSQSGVLAASPVQVSLISGPQYISGPSVFARGASSITYNASVSAAFTFTTSFRFDIQYNSGSFSQLILTIAVFVNGGNAGECYMITPVDGGGVTGGSTEQHTGICSVDLYLNNGDQITAVALNFISGPTGFLGRIQSGSTSNYYVFEQFS